LYSQTFAFLDVGLSTSYNDVCICVGGRERCSRLGCGRCSSSSG